MECIALLKNMRNVSYIAVQEYQIKPVHTWNIARLQGILIYILEQSIYIPGGKCIIIHTPTLIFIRANDSDNNESQYLYSLYQYTTLSLTSIIFSKSKAQIYIFRKMTRI